jgi:transcriptional regulator with XRE-family HTH domain
MSWTVLFHRSSIASSRAVWRVAVAFVTKRQAILVVAGDKSGGSEKRFYRQLIRTADKWFDDHVEGLKEEDEAMKTLNDKMAELNERRRQKIEARAAELAAEEMSLRDLRQNHRLTQARLGKALKIGQDGVSRLEQRSDLLISTLRNYVEAMGGDLQLIAAFSGSASGCADRVDCNRAERAAEREERYGTPRSSLTRTVCSRRQAKGIFAVDRSSPATRRRSRRSVDPSDTEISIDRRAALSPWSFNQTSSLGAHRFTSRHEMASGAVTPLLPRRLSW